MKIGKILVYTIAFLSFSASIGYGSSGDWRQSAYFFLAGCINLVMA